MNALAWDEDPPGSLAHVHSVFRRWLGDEYDLAALDVVLAAAAVFVPCYLMVLVLAPFYRHVVKNPQIKAFVSGVTAAATGEFDANDATGSQSVAVAFQPNGLLFSSTMQASATQATARRRASECARMNVRLSLIAPPIP